MDDRKLDDIQPEMDRSTEPHLDVSQEPQTMSMKHRDEAETEATEDARLDKGRDVPRGDEEAGNKTSLLWNE